MYIDRYCAIGWGEGGSAFGLFSAAWGLGTQGSFNTGLSERSFSTGCFLLAHSRVAAEDRIGAHASYLSEGSLIKGPGRPVALPTLCTQVGMGYAATSCWLQCTSMRPRPASRQLYVARLCSTSMSKLWYVCLGRRSNDSITVPQCPVLVGTDEDTIQGAVHNILGLLTRCNSVLSPRMPLSRRSSPLVLRTVHLE